MIAVPEQLMAKSKRGRPAKGKSEVTARIDVEIMKRVKWLASLEDPKVTIGEYLSGVLKPIIDKKYQAALKREFVEGKRDAES